ncbi:MAG: TRAP transporter small permease subunit [Alphaproteobacteria bacterium]
MSDAPQNNPNTAPFNQCIIKIGHWVALLYFFAVIITVFEVLMRYVFHAPTVWVYETSVLFIGLSMLYGGCYCMATGGHISVSFIRDAMPKKLRNINDIIVATFTFLFTLSLIYAAWIMTQKALFTPSGIFRLERSGSAWNSPMPSVIKVALLIVVILMCIQAFMQLILAIRRPFIKGEER